MHQPKTITGSLVQRTSQGTSEPPPEGPGDDEHKLGILLRLGAHFWQPDFTPAQAKYLLADYLEDLQSAPVADLDRACREWRRKAENKRFPKIGELLKLIVDLRPMSGGGDRLVLAPFSDRPMMWWALPKHLWNFAWRENDVPAGEFIKDETGGKIRKPVRV